MYVRENALHCGEKPCTFIDINRKLAIVRCMFIRIRCKVTEVQRGFTSIQERIVSVRRMLIGIR
jgi:hypothetical protein